jgi:hypothetical protein
MASGQIFAYCGNTARSDPISGIAGNDADAQSAASGVFRRDQISMLRLCRLH